METSAPAAAPSAPAASSSTPSSTPSAQTSTPSSPSSSSPTRKTTQELAQQLSERSFVNTKAAVENDLSQQAEATPEPETPQGEQPWYESYKDGIHGVQVQDLLKAIQDGQLPEALYDKLKFTLKDGDTEWESDIHGLRDGAQMRAKFTQKTQALAQEKKSFYAERDEFVDYLRGWKSDPKKALMGLERLGVPILDVATILVDRLNTAEAMNKVAAGTGDQWLAAQQQMAEYEEMKAREQAATERAKQNDNSKREADTSKRLRDASVETFNKIGLKLEEGSWNLYREHVQAILDDKPADKQKLTKQDLETAARRTKQQLSEWGQRHAAASSKPSTPGAKLGLTPLDPGGAKAPPARAPKKPGQPKTTAEVAAELAARQGIRQR